MTEVVAGDVVAVLHDDMTQPLRTLADEVVVPAAAAALLPPGLDEIPASTVPLNGTTAAQALARLGPANGRSLLITGAAGAVGGYALALAAGDDWQVTALARQGDSDFVFGLRASELITEIPAAAFDAVLDAAALQDAALSAVRDGGDFVGVLPANPLTPERGINVQAVLVKHDGRLLADLLEKTASGQIPARVAGQARLSEASGLVDRLRGGGQRGRVVLVP